jgi:predicted lipoprotein with Yx(FWY)xxD motif
MFPKLMMMVRAPGRSKWKRAAYSVAAVTAIGLVAAACGSSSKHSVVSSTASKAASSSTPTVVATADNSKYGVILTTRTGFALYTYTADDPGGPGCTGECLKFWPPLLLPAGASQPVAGPGISGLGTFARDGRLQVTFKGMPLYTYVTDKSPGQTTGQNVVDSGGKWLLAIVTPAGTQTPVVTAPQVTSPPMTSPPVTTVPPTTQRTSPPTTAPPGLPSY